jgi:hypothetical protein
LEAQGHEHVAKLPLGRYRDLVEHVWLQLPDGWDSHVSHWDVAADEIPSDVDTYLAGARLVSEDDEEQGQEWSIVLCTTRLDPLSNDDVISIIAHEFAHVATGLPTDPRIRNTTLHEDRANFMTRVWGFQPRVDEARERLL